MKKFCLSVVLIIIVLTGCHHHSDAPSSTTVVASFLDAQSPAFKIYAVNPALYPYVMAYFRTMDGNRDPLINLNVANVALYVEGQVYDPYKKQYVVQTLKERREGFRTVLVLDCSASMAGQPFSNMLDAARSFIDFKSPSDEIGILALTDTVQTICPFTKDKGRLRTYLNDLKPIGRRTPIYDGLGTAIQACFTGRASVSFTSSDPEVTILSNIVIITDGEDNGSALTRADLLRNIENMRVPIPIYSVIYTGKPGYNVTDLAYISTASFGRYWTIDAMSYLSSICSKIQDINRNDYVLTFKSYLPVDGHKHIMKIGVNYAGFLMFNDAEFETMNIQMATPGLRDLRSHLDRQIPKLDDNNPYMTSSQSSPPYGSSEIPAGK
ncbi:MAG: VWA domain-containing protein [bacterium]